MSSFLIANAVESVMTAFFSRIMEHLKVYLTGELSEEEMPLQIQALGKVTLKCFLNCQSRLISIHRPDTLGVIARTIGEETFLPFADECLQFTLNLAKSKDDPDLRKCVYGKRYRVKLTRNPLMPGLFLSRRLRIAGDGLEGQHGPVITCRHRSTRYGR